MKKFNKIFICGLSRTGTKSIGDYLQLLGLKIRHNGGQIFNPYEIQNIDVLLDDKQTQFCYERLHSYFPNSLFIYTNRNDESWVNKIISWKPDYSYIFHQMFGVVFSSPDSEDALYKFKREHLKRFEVFASDLDSDRVLYLDLEDSEKDKKVCEFLNVEYNSNIEYPNIKYR